ncbi:MAG: hypothetical protein HY606_02980 [Planctomycetes bacterium]|nr:hypothetical protein [Planctomycetota bacterium]
MRPSGEVRARAAQALIEMGATEYQDKILALLSDNSKFLYDDYESHTTDYETVSDVIHVTCNRHNIDREINLKLAEGKLSTESAETIVSHIIIADHKTMFKYLKSWISSPKKYRLLDNDKTAEIFSLIYSKRIKGTGIYDFFDCLNVVPSVALKKRILRDIMKIKPESIADLDNILDEVKKLNAKELLPDFTILLDNTMERSEDHHRYNGFFSIKWLFTEMYKIGEEEVVDYIAKYLDRKDSYSITNAMEALVEIKSTRYKDKIAGYLDHADPYIRITAAKALCHLDLKEYSDKIESTALSQNHHDIINYELLAHVCLWGKRNYINDIFKLILKYPSSNEIYNIFIKSKPVELVNELCQLLDSYDYNEYPNKSIVAATILMEIDPNEHIEKVAKLLDYDDKITKSVAISLIVKHGFRDYSDKIALLLESIDIDLRRQAFESLIKLKETKYVDKMFKFLSESNNVYDCWVRDIKALITPDHSQIIGSLLDSKKVLVKNEAIKIIGELKLVEHKEKLISMLKEDESNLLLIDSLISIDADKYRDHLLKPLTQISDHNLQWRTIDIISRRKVTKYADEVSKLLNPDSSFYLKQVIINALVNLEYANGAEKIADLLKNEPYDNHQELYIQALARLNAVQYAKTIAEYIDDPNPKIKGNAVIALKTLNASDFADELSKLAGDTTEFILYNYFETQKTETQITTVQNCINEALKHFESQKVR